MRSKLCIWAIACAALASAAPAAGQGGTSSTLSGVVVDTGGGVLPGADVTVKNDATGVSLASITNGQGAFSFPGLNVGTYTVTVSLQGSRASSPRTSFSPRGRQRASRPPSRSAA